MSGNTTADQAGKFRQVASRSSPSTKRAKSAAAEPIRHAKLVKDRASGKRPGKPKFLT